MSLSKEEIQTEISNCLKETDPRYFNPSFNLMTEIVNVFGDINFDKVKIDIDRLNQINTKLDNVIKVIVDKHSDEFFKILGFVREMKKILEVSKLKYDYAKVSLGSLTSTIGNLASGNNSEWKLRSIFCNEIINKLTKTQNMLETLQDVSVFVKNNKLYDAIDLLKSKEAEHNEYDKEFRNFNILVNINLRFNKLNNEISERIQNALSDILFFDNDIVMTKKIFAIISFFVNYYAKISIDTEMIKPLSKFITLINQVVSYKPLSDLNNDDKHQSSIELNSDKAINSLFYLIKCIKSYAHPELIKTFIDKLNLTLGNMITKGIKILTEQMKNMSSILSKYDLESKSEKIKFLLFTQTSLILLVHSVSKINYMIKALSPMNKTYETQIYFNYELAAILPLISLQRGVNVKQEEVIASSVLSNFSYEQSDYYQCENFLRHKINEIPNLNVEYLPMMYKIYYHIYTECKEKYDIDFNNLKNILTLYTTQLYAYYSKKILIKKNFFDLSTFIYEYDNEISNFKFINDLTNKIDTLKRLLVFAFDTSYSEIMKIVRSLFLKFTDDTKTFITKLKKDCVHHNLFTNVYESLLKSSEIDTLLLDLQFRKYQTKLLDKKTSKDELHSSLSKSISAFILNVIRTTKPNENLYLITRNYKLMELLTKFIVSTESITSMSENFIYDLMKMEFSQAKIIAMLQQVGHIAFDNISDAVNVDISTLILVSLSTLDKLSYEVVKILVLLKIEFCCLIISLARNMSRNTYWLNEPQMTPEFFVTSFVNEFNMYNALFQYNLNENEFSFIKQDFLLILNNVFVECVRNMDIHLINNFGVNLLVRDFEFIKEKMGAGYDFADSKFTESIFYFTNYVKLVNVNEDKVSEELKRYYEVMPFDENFVSPLLKIRSNTRNTLNEIGKNTIVSMFK